MNSTGKRWIVTVKGPTAQKIAPSDLRGLSDQLGLTASRGGLVYGAYATMQEVNTATSKLGRMGLQLGVEVAVRDLDGDPTAEMEVFIFDRPGELHFAPPERNPGRVPTPPSPEERKRGAELFAETRRTQFLIYAATARNAGVPEQRIAWALEQQEPGHAFARLITEQGRQSEQ
jgi:hypothetical protein